MRAFARTIVSAVAVIGATLGASAALAQAPAGGTPALVEGKHYTRITPAVPQSTPPGTVEVTEVFSYGCPACFQASGFVAKLKKSLPPKAVMTYVPASWIQAEAWPMFQRAYLTAQAMGIAEKTHDEMFQAIWRTGEIPLTDPATGRIRRPLPTIEDAAKFYAKHAGVKAEDFVATSKSFAVETRIGQAEKLVRAYRAESTPTFVVAGKYKVATLGSYDEVIGVVRALVDRELAEIGGKK